MVNDKRDPIADAIWVYGSAWIGAALLGLYAAGTTGAIAAAMLAIIATVVLRMK
jgi:hypothetical protein